MKLWKGWAIVFETGMGSHLACYDKHSNAQLMARTFGDVEPPVFRVVAKLTRERRRATSAAGKAVGRG